MKFSLRSILTLTSLGLVAITGGTSAAAPNHAAGRTASPSAASPQPAPSAADASETETVVHGSVEMIGDALDDVTLRPDQGDAIELVGLAIAPYEHVVDQAEADLLSTLADQVRSGQLDRTALQPKIDAYVAARQHFADPFRGALALLHLYLDPGQRDDLGDALQSRVHDAVMSALAADRVTDFEEALGADDSQSDEIEDAFEQIMPTIDADREDIHAAIEGFRGDDFSLDDYIPMTDVEAKARLRAELIVDTTDEILGVLEQDQRDMLASRIASAARIAEQGSQGTATAARHDDQAGTGEASQHIWIAGYGRGPWTRSSVVVGGMGVPAYSAWYGTRVGAYPIVAGWGLGW